LVPDCHQLATDIDHVVPIGTWQGSPFDTSNVQGLCRRHYSAKTAREVFGRT
jgi:hypothetical protein